MQKTAYTMIAMIVLVGSMAVAAQAQNSGRTRLVANIPFQFNVGSKTLPPGEYELRQLNTVSGPAMLQLRSRDYRSAATVQMQEIAGKAQESAKLVFNRYGNHYYFAQAWIDGDTIGLQAPKSRAERATEREMAGVKMATESVALRARR